MAWGGLCQSATDALEEEAPVPSRGRRRRHRACNGDSTAAVELEEEAAAVERNVVVLALSPTPTSLYSPEALVCGG